MGERVEKGREHLDETLEVVRTLCEPVEAPRHQDDFRRYFVGPDLLSDENARRRMVLYRAVAALLRDYADIAPDLEAAGFSATEAAQLTKEVKFYENVQAEIRVASADFPDLKQYEPAMRHLIDTYIDADESRVLTAFDDMPLVQLLVERGKEAALNALPASIRNNREAVAETIVNNVRRLIINAQSTNPIYFGKMSEVLEALVERRKEAVLEYEAYLNSVIDVAKNATNPPRSQYPASLKTRGQQALYDNFGQDETLTLALDTAIHGSARNGWHGNDMKIKEIRNAIRKILRDQLNDATQTDAILKIVEQQPEYRK